ncbi:MAG TPA: phospholipase D-like domain-containing protein [Thermoanaerobaculia bacterium]|nr:phospholipase D-like domain-containing protein [Thermoanaerobaculia bacterium]
MRRAFTLPLFCLASAGLLGSCGCTVISDLIGSEKRDVYKFDHPFAVADPAFRRSLDTFGTTMIPGNTAELLKNGDEIFPAMTAAIRQAQKTVNLETYIFQPDEGGKQFADAMIDAARRGVEVRLLIDAWGSKLDDLREPLEKAGVHWRKYRPVRLFSIYKVGKRTHRKILVVDGKVAFTGGLGIQKRWLGNARNSNEWRDTQVRVTGPVVDQMQAIFAEDWTYTTGEILAGEKFYPKPDGASGSVHAQAIKISRGDASSLAKMLYYVAIQSAVKSIHIQNAYFLPDKQVRDALVAAVARGVDVKVMVPGRHIDLPMARFASWLHYGEMLKGGVKIYEYRDTMMHNKTMVVDGMFSTIGSINFDTRSMNRNAEESLAFYEHAFAQKMEAMFDEDLKRCDEITLDAFSHRGLAKRASELISYIWEPYY